MKVAVVYNRESRSVINLFGTPSREKYGLKAIGRIVEGLKSHGHQVRAYEGDKDLVRNLEDFMPRVLQGERPGMVFNLSYGIQGQSRYTHVPGILEMVGIPYVGSGPLAHSLALDKVVAKMMFRQHGIPTPEFAVLTDPDSPIPDLPYPMIVKPKNESTSFGLEVVQDEAALRKATQVIFDEFQQPVLVEQYIDGREVNVGILGNEDPEVFPPAELDFGDGPKIYTLADKRHKSGREVGVRCPADLDEAIAKRAQEVSLGAFRALGCADCARIDLRLDGEGNVYVLEINSLPSLGEHGSYVQGAEAIGLDFPGLVNRLVEVAAARYFGTPSPTRAATDSSDPREAAFAYVTKNRDNLERSVEKWVDVIARTHDPVDVQVAFQTVDTRLREIGLRPGAKTPRASLSRVWETEAGFAGGTLVLGHIDSPLADETPHHRFRREGEMLHGEAIASSRGPLAMLELALRFLKQRRLLKKAKLGVLLVGDEGAECRQSAETIRNLAQDAKRVVVLHPGTPKGQLVVGRRGLRRYRLTVSTEAHRLGQPTRKPDALGWTAGRIEAVRGVAKAFKGAAFGVTALEASSHPGLLPHRVSAMASMSYVRPDLADELEKQVRDTLGKKGPRWELELLSDRPPMARTPQNEKLAARITAHAERSDVPLGVDSSLQPSPAGLVPDGVAAVCGLAPVGRDVGTPHEAIQRLSLAQRALLLTQLLYELAKEDSK